VRYLASRGFAGETLEGVVAQDARRTIG
jgi:hypothetical protein